MIRTVETAAIATSTSELLMENDPDLREIDFGRWEALTFQEICDLDQAHVDRWAAYGDDFAFPGGESLCDFHARIRRVADRIARDPADVVCAFTHGGVIRTLICHYLGLEPRNYLMFDVRTASVTTLSLYDGKGVLTGLNDCCHLLVDRR
jgi:alpha-ribazole phosphatase/probable phosphoglycerate mutase